MLLSFVVVLPSSAQNNRSVTCRQSGSYVARLEEGQSEFDLGTIFCEGDVIQNPVAVSLLCFSSRVRTPAFTGESLVVNLALCEQTVADRQSTAEECRLPGPLRRLCFIAKGPTDSQFQIFQPDAVSGSRPDISWESVPNAISYTVYVAGPEISWERTVDSEETSLQYPQEENDLQIGAAHQVVINANGPQEQVSASASRVVNVSADAAHVRDLQLAARTNGAQ